MATDEKMTETENLQETKPELSPVQEEKREKEKEAKEPEKKPVSEESLKLQEDSGEESKPDLEFEKAISESLDLVLPEKGAKLKGTILLINEENALVDCGAKSEAVIAANELNGHKVGDEIEGLVLTTDPLVISIKLDGKETSNEEHKSAFENEIPVTGKIVREIKGGFDVDIAGTRAFLPISHLDISFIKETAPFVGQTFDFKIIEYSDNGRQFVVSRAEILKKDQGKNTEKIWETLKAGEIVEGTVRSIQNFGAFIDLGGIEGLLHISELSNDYTTHPSDMLSIGSTVKVSILSADKEKNRISLSMKDLAPDPWANYGSEVVIGDNFTGTIVRKAEFGLFIQLAPGIDGLLHVSQLDPSTELADEKYAIGNKLNGWIRSVDLENKRVGLTLHEMPSNDPWASINENYKTDDVFEGTVEESTQFGVFIELQPGLTGLMPLSELKKLGFKSIDSEFKPQEKLKVKITAIDEGRQRISLLPVEIPEHIVPETKKPGKKKARPKKKEKSVEAPNGSAPNGGVTAFGEVLAAALNKTDEN
ncbi:MAG: S1 RNA-binding domain-containing protein [Calditrichaeota bacterium]|nr:MAG: S1 RNA-binding domain-containing protein [Calditrichota bacterium]